MTKTLILISILFWAAIAIRCSDLLQQTEAPKTFDFNKTIAAVAGMSEQVAGLNDNLAQMLAGTNTHTYQFVDPVATAISSAQLIVAGCALALQEAQFAYQISNDLKNAAAEQKRQVIEDEQYRNLSKQNDIMIERLGQVQHAIKDAANQISGTIIESNFNNDVESKMLDLLFNYELVKKTQSLEHIDAFTQLCNGKDTKPTKVINNMVSLADEMFTKALTEDKYQETRFFLIVNMYLRMTHQFVLIYPYCSAFVYQSDASVTNETLFLSISYVDVALKRNGVDRTKLFTNVEFMSSLYATVPKDSDDAQNYYNLLLSTFSGLERYLSQTYAYIVTTDTKLEDYSLGNNANLTFEKVEFGVVKVFKLPILNNNCTGDSCEKPCICDYYAKDFCQSRDESSDRGENVVHFLQDHCKKTSFIVTHSKPCEQTGWCSAARIAGHDQFRKNFISCPPDALYIRDMINYFMA